MKSTPIVSTLLLVTAAAAQGTAIFPGDHANIANGASYSSNLPYALGVSRVMSIYEAWDIGVPIGHQITAIGVRQDGTNASTGHSLQLEARMGTTIYDASTVTSTFDSNYLTGPVTVFPNGLYSLPNLQSSTTGQQIMLPLTTPYTYNGGNLVIEWRIAANNNGNLGFTYYTDVATYVSTDTHGPQACQNSGGTRAVLSSSPTYIGGTWSLNISGAPASAIGFLLVQMNSPLVTPFSLQTLVPGISPTCLGQLNLAAFTVVAGFPTDGGGNHYWSITVPNNRIPWYQATIETQAAILDFFAPGGIVVSSGDQVQFGIQPANTIIFASGPGSTTATTGSVYRNYGLVTLFQYN